LGARARLRHRSAKRFAAAARGAAIHDVCARAYEDAVAVCIGLLCWEEAILHVVAFYRQYRRRHSAPAWTLRGSMAGTVASGVVRNRASMVFRRRL
jgi:hypothetical protein